MIVIGCTHYHSALCLNCIHFKKYKPSSIMFQVNSSPFSFYVYIPFINATLVFHGLRPDWLINNEKENLGVSQPQ
jgi:hypothetical protein